MVAYGVFSGSLRTEFDVIIVGTGIGGATLGYALSKPGRSILFLEQGLDLSGPTAVRGLPAEAHPEFALTSCDKMRDLLARAGRNSEPAEDGVRNDSFVPFIGSGTGGSSSLYGMVLERLFPRDFETWPVSYEDMAPWYAAAEVLYEVYGGSDPVRKDSACLRKPPALSEASAVIFDHLKQRDLHPYRLHVASRQTSDCRMCQGFLCSSSKQCKNDARTVCLLPAIEKGDSRLMTGVKVTHLESDGRRITGVHAVSGCDQSVLRAKVVVLAAGALSTPRILIQSGNLANESGLVGRRLMRHAIDLFVLTLAPRIHDIRASKELGLNDFYWDGRDRLGTIQSFGMAPTLEYLRNKPGHNLWKILGPAAIPIAKLFSSCAILGSILEDDPDPNNSVEPGRNGMRITYRLSADDLRRRKALRRHVLRAFGRFGPLRVFGTSDREALGHVCGTTRFGDDPAQSVLNRFNRAHRIDNLYVVDSSFFPTSGGVNPALTVAANALRVARHLEDVL